MIVCWDVFFCRTCIGTYVFFPRDGIVLLGVDIVKEKSGARLATVCAEQMLPVTIIARRSIALARLLFIGTT